MLKNIANLIKVKTIVTFVVLAVWAYIAVDSADSWSEIDAPVPEDEDATEADYLAALNELGVS